MLLHGWLGDSATWDRQVPALRRRRRTVAVDLRGHGRSPTPDTAYTPDELAGDVERLLTGLRLAPAVLFGHSYGGSLATILAVRRPDLVRALVLVDPDYAGDPRARPPDDWLDALASPAGTALAQTALATLEGPHTPPALRDRHRMEAARVPAFVRARMLRAHMAAAGGIRFRPGSDAWLARRRQPVLAFHRDPERAAVEQHLRQHPATRVIHVSGTGHWLHQERPDLVSRELERWFAHLSRPHRI
ncbi:alpha/beta fold hydrolase [Phytohabitans kaempferiae]|uniref:Alpha/beta fold hydrolase n=1 Tax=Phytohabitans kaempferiae TaxID=1620943 RepID=A0ABV6MAI7_9ACTN